MARDRLISSAILDGGDAAPAFPLGGANSAPTFAADVPRVLTPDEVSPAASLIVLVIPAGRTLYAARRSKVGSLTGDAARAVMHPFAGGTERTVTLTDEHQPNFLFLADASGPLTVNILEAATVGGGAA